MAFPITAVRWTLPVALMLSVATAFAQSELRTTFFRDADSALAAANAANAELLAPTRYAAGKKDYQAAEAGLERGRNVEYVRSKAADAAANFNDAAKTARLGKT